MKIFFTGLIIVFSLNASAENSEKNIRDAVRRIVNQRHPEIPEKFWEKLGPEAVPVLKKMYDESKTAQERSLIIDGLAHSKDSSTGEFLESAVSGTSNEVLKRKLLDAVIRSEGERSFAFVEPYLKNEDSQIRLTIAKGLMAFSDNDKIKKRLDEFQSGEKSTWILAELKKKGTDEKRLKIDQSGKTVMEAEKTKTVEPLSEKKWAGLWRGSLVTESKMVLVDATLTLMDANKIPVVWKVEMKFPKQPKQEWKQGDFSLHYFQTNRAHWIEIRNQRLDTVFIAQRKAK